MASSQIIQRRTKHKTTQSRAIVIKRKDRWLEAAGTSTLIVPNSPGGTSKANLGLQGAQSESHRLLWDANFYSHGRNRIEKKLKRILQSGKTHKISFRDIYFRIGLDIMEVVNMRLIKSLTIL